MLLILREEIGHIIYEINMFIGWHFLEIFTEDLIRLVCFSLADKYLAFKKEVLRTIKRFYTSCIFAGLVEVL